MNPSLDWDKLGRYLAGEASPDEAAEIRRWLEQHPDEAKRIVAMNEAIGGLEPQAGLDVETALASVKTRMRSPAPSPTAGSASRWGRRVGSLEAWAAAAAVLIVAGIALWRGRDGRKAIVSEVPTAVHSTAVGERRTVRLEDGTEIMLGPASRISARGRDVVLAGEAFFRVVHDGARPFTVHAGQAVIRDVGTVFSVHDDGDSHVRVVVSEGAVQLSDVRDSVLLSRGDVGLLQGGRLTVERGTATAEDLAWTTGKLVFRDAAIEEVSADLKRWYGVELRVTDSALLRRHFTGSFSSESTNRVLDVLALALGARAERHGDTVYIRGSASSR
ncbi:MAG TPA: FecR domain-containing protein [Gemmatimonadaceae bacterium]|nr:FecR domain-containing protein [Gemmatimonadaceae bacterium]